MLFYTKKISLKNRYNIPLVACYAELIPEYLDIVRNQ